MIILLKIQKYNRYNKFMMTNKILSTRDGTDKKSHNRLFNSKI